MEARAGVQSSNGANYLALSTDLSTFHLGLSCTFEVTFALGHFNARLALIANLSPGPILHRSPIESQNTGQQDGPHAWNTHRVASHASTLALAHTVKLKLR